MADTKTSALTALIAPAPNDLVMVVDVSDTTMAAEGTNKKVVLSDLRQAVAVFDDSQAWLASQFWS